MTTIVTTQSKSYAVMVSDQGITSDLIHPQMPKIVKQGTWLIGVCGTDRVCDVIQYATKLPKPPATLTGKNIEDWYPWIVTRVIPVIQKAIQENLHKDYWNTLGESQAIIVTHGKAFLIGETLGLTKAHPYWAIGSGSHLAMGCLSQKVTAVDWKNRHSTYAKEAIEVAKLHDPFTRGEVTGYKSYASGKITTL
jgi:20S proteasome alpha/beta subunit